jgi:hypothetical protein
LDFLANVFILRINAGVKLNLAKCTFLDTELVYLSHAITQVGAKPDKWKFKRWRIRAVER